MNSSEHVNQQWELFAKYEIIYLVSQMGPIDHYEEVYPTRVRKWLSEPNQGDRFIIGPGGR